MKKKNINLGPTWGTRHELVYLAKIGTYFPDVRKRMSKKQLLTQYIYAGENLRVNWGNMDKDKILSTAKSFLTKCK